MVLGLLAVIRRPLELTPTLEIHLTGLGVQQMLGIQASFDTFGQVDFLFRIQQAYASDLLQVVLDRIGGGAGSDYTTLRVAGRSQIVVVIIISHDESALFLGLLRLLAFLVVLILVIFRLGFLILVEIGLIVFRVDVVEIIVEIVEIGLIDLILFAIKGIFVLDRLILPLGGSFLLRGSLTWGLRGRGLLVRSFLGGGLARGGFLRGGGLIGQISLFSARRRFLSGQTYPPA